MEHDNDGGKYAARGNNVLPHRRREACIAGPGGTLCAFPVEVIGEDGDNGHAV